MGRGREQGTYFFSLLLSRVGKVNKRKDFWDVLSDRDRDSNRDRVS